MPVFCTLKCVAPYSNLLDRHGGGGQGNFKVVCNTPYNMHMGGSWDPPGWPHGHQAGHDDDGHKHKDMDVELRVTGQSGTKQALCAFAAGKAMSCRTFADDDGAGPPRVAQAQVTIDNHSTASHGPADRPHTADAGGYGLFGRVEERAPKWGGRMGLGALPRVASAGELTYLPSFVTDAVKTNDAGSSGDDFGLAGDDEQITLFLTVTGRY